MMRKKRSESSASILGRLGFFFAAGVAAVVAVAADGTAASTATAFWSVALAASLSGTPAADGDDVIGSAAEPTVTPPLLSRFAAASITIFAASSLLPPLFSLLLVFLLFPHLTADLFLLIA